MAPKAYEVSKSIIIDKPLKDVFIYLKSLKNKDNCSPWTEKDSNKYCNVVYEHGNNYRW